MNNAPLEILFGILILLILISAYFSGSETAMMSLNRYRLRHLAKHKHHGAIRVSKLLNQPERLIGIILIGNNFVNILASSIATIIAIRLWGEAGIFIATLLLTIVILIFAEVTPKTIAAAQSEKIAYPSSIILAPLLRVFYPLVWLVNTASNALLKILGLQALQDESHHLSSEELRTVVDESGALIPVRRQNMLLNVLDLEKVTVNDIMVPRNEIAGIDLDDEVEEIIKTITSSNYTRLPVFKSDINNTIGILHLRSATQFIGVDKFNKAELVQLTRETYFVPESTPLHTQLVNFQKQKRRIAMVVDEYGVIQGIITLEDILEEIVGNFTTNLAEQSDEIHPQPDGSFLIDGSINIREINRSLDWDLPTSGAKTLSGLLTEILQNIPEHNVGIRLPYHCAEIIQVKDNMVKTVKMWAHEPKSKSPEQTMDVQLSNSEPVN